MDGPETQGGTEFFASQIASASFTLMPISAVSIPINAIAVTIGGRLPTPLYRAEIGSDAQPVSENLTRLSRVTPGAAGKTLLAATLVDEIWRFLGSIPDASLPAHLKRPMMNVYVQATDPGAVGAGAIWIVP